MPRSKNKSASVRAREAKLAMRLLRVKRLKEASTAQKRDDEEQSRVQDRKQKQEQESLVKATVQKNKGDVAYSGQVKAAVAAHPGNLAAEANCEKLADADDGTSSPNCPTSTVHESKRAQEEDILQSRQKSTQQPGELIKDLGQPQPISERAAFANHVHDSLLTMKKSKFRKMRSAINKLLTQVMDDSEDEDDPRTPPTVQPNMPLTVRSFSPSIL